MGVSDNPLKGGWAFPSNGTLECDDRSSLSDLQDAGDVSGVETPMPKSVFGLSSRKIGTFIWNVVAWTAAGAIGLGGVVITKSDAASRRRKHSFNQIIMFDLRLSAMAVGGGDGERSLQNTPTWAVALVCAVFVIISVLIERGIQSLGELFRKRHKKEMSEVLEKIKAELMLLGFISLLLTVGTKPISEMCISEKASTFMLPCKKETTNNGGGGEDHCSKHDKVPLVSQTGIHQLHIFIFVLGIVHVLYSIFTIALAKAKMKKWQSWESETSSLEYEYSTDPSRFRFVRQTSFVQRHTAGISTTPGLRWIVAFFRQFFHSVTKVDYLTLRHGFINAHFAQNRKFNFHNYIKRSMEDDFKVVVGVSLPLWACTILFLILNVYGWYTFIWISFVPLAIMLIVGAKFEIIIMEMAQQIQDKTAVVKGVPVVEPSNKYFWFNRPDIILFLVHLSLFQNAFQMAFFLWTLYEFGLSSCFHENHAELIARHLFAVVLQCFCSYVTFPLYALVTQMGSHMKKAIFEEQTAKALKNWQKAAKERKRLRNKEKGGGEMSPGFMSPVSTPSGGSSPLHLLHKYKPSSGPDIETGLTSPKPYYSEKELSDMDGCPPSTRESLEPSRGSKNPNANGENLEQEPTRQNNKNPNKGENDSGDFSFAMSSKA